MDRSELSSRADLSVAGFLIFTVAVLTGIGFAVHSMMQPTVLANPGMAAYKAPPRAVVLNVPTWAETADKMERAALATAEKENPIPRTVVADTAKTGSEQIADRASARSRLTKVVSHARRHKPTRTARAQVRRREIAYAREPSFFAPRNYGGPVWW
jgi:hypothetical protein